MSAIMAQFAKGKIIKLWQSIFLCFSSNSCTDIPTYVTCVQIYRTGKVAF